MTQNPEQSIEAQHRLIAEIAHQSHEIADQLIRAINGPIARLEENVALETLALLVRIVRKSVLASAPAHLTRAAVARQIDDESRREGFVGIIRNEILQLEVESRSSARARFTRAAANGVSAMESQLLDLLMSIRLAVRGAGDLGASPVTGEQR